MQVSEARLAANRANALKSRGPVTEAGKSRSRANATKHGMAGESSSVEAGASPEFDERRARWAAEFRPAGEGGDWALDQAVVASFRIEKCGRTLERVAKLERERARLAWDQDRAVEAAAVLGRLSRDPALAARQLEATLAGVRLLIDAWFALAHALEGGGDWSEAEAAKALDLLGVPPDGRSWRRPIDPPEGSDLDAVAFRRALVSGELDRLEALRDEALAPLDELGRESAMAGDLALLSKPAKLALRYERDAWRRYRESVKELKARAQAPAVEDPAPATGPAPAPAVGRPKAAGVARNEANPAPSLAEERRSLLDQAVKVLAGYPGLPASIHLDDESDWLDDLGTSLPARRNEPNFAAARPAGRS